MRHARKAPPPAPSRLTHGRHIGLAAAVPANDNPAPRWKRVLAGTMDLLSATFLGASAVDSVMGGLLSADIEAALGPVLILAALVASYFYVFDRFLGGTPWRRAFGLGRG